MLPYSYLRTYNKQDVLKRISNLETVGSILYVNSFVFAITSIAMGIRSYVYAIDLYNSYYPDETQNLNSISGYSIQSNIDSLFGLFIICFLISGLVFIVTWTLYPILMNLLLPKINPNTSAQYNYGMWFFWVPVIGPICTYISLKSILKEYKKYTGDVIKTVKDVNNNHEYSYSSYGTSRLSWGLFFYLTSLISHPSIWLVSIPLFFTRTKIHPDFIESATALVSFVGVMIVIAAILYPAVFINDFNSKTLEAVKDKVKNDPNIKAESPIAVSSKKNEDLYIDHIQKIKDKVKTNADKAFNTNQSNDFVLQLEKLKSLHDSGAINDEEYTKAKNIILNQLDK